MNFFFKNFILKLEYLFLILGKLILKFEFFGKVNLNFRNFDFNFGIFNLYFEIFNLYFGNWKF